MCGRIKSVMAKPKMAAPRVMIEYWKNLNATGCVKFISLLLSALDEPAIISSTERGNMLLCSLSGVIYNISPMYQSLAFRGGQPSQISSRAKNNPHGTATISTLRPKARNNILERSEGRPSLKVATRTPP